MQQGTALWIALVAIALLVVAAIVAWFLAKPAATPLGALRDRLPERVGDWVAAEAPDQYDTVSIFGYIDGHAEVYLAYGMRGCLARRFSGPEGEADLVLDLFEMGSPADAFGVFTHDQDGEPAGVGQDSLLRYGWLSFWKGRFFVSIVAESETERSTRAVLDLGHAVAALIEEEGSLPAFVTDLPSESLVERSVRFLRDPQILSTHLPLITENPFGLGDGTPAALGTYRQGSEQAHLLLVDYPDAAAADRAGKAFRSRFVPAEHGEGPASFAQEGWFAIRFEDRRLAAVLGADSEEFARALLDRALGASSEGDPQ